MDKLKELWESITPILIEPDKAALRIGISKRFFLFQMMNKLVSFVEEDPHLNFIALLKSYKILGDILTGTLHDFHRDRNKLYFRSFFLERSLYETVKKDIEELYPAYKEVKMTITKRGVIVYDNYRKNSFNILLLTIHSGSWVPEPVRKKLSMTDAERVRQEDNATDKLYRKLVLDNAGIWIDNKQSRFVIDFNRALSNAIYANNSEEWLDIVWKEELTTGEADEIYASYKEFYFTLARILETFRLDIILDGHSMNDQQRRPDISFGTRYIPRFYMPIVRSMQKRMKAQGYNDVAFDKPYKGGFILKWLSQKFPNLFICSIEINKRLYLKSGKIDGPGLRRISEHIAAMLDIKNESSKSTTKKDEISEKIKDRHGD